MSIVKNNTSKPILDSCIICECNRKYLISPCISCHYDVCDECVDTCDLCEKSVCSDCLTTLVCEKKYCKRCIANGAYCKKINVVTTYSEWHRHNITEMRYVHCDDDSENYSGDDLENYSDEAYYHYLDCQICKNYNDNYVQCTKCPEGELIKNDDIYVTCECGNQYCYKHSEEIACYYDFTSYCKCGLIANTKEKLWHVMPRPW